MNSVFNFSNFHAVYPTSGVNVSGLARVYCIRLLDIGRRYQHPHMISTSRFMFISYKTVGFSRQVTYLQVQAAASKCRNSATCESKQR
jgi:Ni/Fe-hydrogenase subunit HybB-like protein